MLSKFLMVAFLPALMVGVNAEPNCEPATLDKCVLELTMLSDPNFVWPTTVDEVSAICKKFKVLEKCIKDYSKDCLKASTRQSIGVLIYSISKTNKAFCTNQKRKEALLEIAGCIKPNREKFTELLTDLTKTFHAVREFPEKKMRIPLACCNYHSLKDKAMNLATEKCDGKLVTEIETIIDGYAHDVLNLLCGDYSDDSDKCKGLISKSPKWDKPLESQAFLVPLVQILDSLDEKELNV